MKTRNYFIALILMLSATLAFGQSAEQAKTAFGILGGVNFQTFNGKSFDGSKMENDMVVGFHAGVNVLVPIAPEFYFQPGLLFTTKGSKNEIGSLINTINVSVIEVPLNLVYRGLLGNGHVLVGFGPYVGYSVMGKSKLEGGDVSVEGDIVFQNEVEVGDPLITTYLKPLDAGGNVFVGYEMAGGLFVQLNAQMGMLNINPEDKRFPTDQSEVRNTGFGMSLGYRF